MSGQADEALVSGTLVIGAATPPFRGGTAHVCLEEISYADAPATVVAEETIRDVSHAESGHDTVIPFSLRRDPAAAEIAEENDYAVRAWVDLDSDGSEEADALFSDQSYRVLTRGFGSTVTIMLGSYE